MKAGDATTFPVVDLGTLPNDDPAVGAALVDTGFAIIENHGLPSTRWDEAYAAAARAFALPDKVKSRYVGPTDGSQRGYLPIRTALTDGRDALDRKECWHARPDGHRYENIFPTEVPEFGPLTRELLRELDELVARVLASVDAFLGSPIGTLAETVHGSDSVLRVNHYPDEGVRPAGEQMRFRAHRDFDLITLLLGADRPGLEIQGRDDRWWPLVPSAGGIVVSSGDILEVQSAGRIPSTTHRVVSPLEKDGGRMSMVYFVSPRADIELVSGISAGEFIDRRLRDAGYRR